MTWEDVPGSEEQSADEISGVNEKPIPQQALHRILATQDRDQDEGIARKEFGSGHHDHGDTDRKNHPGQ